jgi:NAD(P)-dependent dehydrogenase (short-subunit alcohol dehydrogenase family)
MSKTIVVTGSSAGIGRAVTDLLIARGDAVIGLDRSAPSDTALERFVAVDLGDEDSITEAIHALEGPVDGLCNVAGVSGVGGADLTMRVNYLGLRALTLGVADRMKAGSTVVNVASIAGAQWLKRKEQHLALARTTSFGDGLKWLAENPVTDTDGYPYSKEALRVWTRFQASEWLPSGIRTNCVNPGPVNTGLRGEFLQSLGAERVEDDIKRVGRDGTAADIAPLIAWLTTDEAAWVNGTDIPADGGLAASFLGDLL